MELEPNVPIARGLDSLVPSNAAMYTTLRARVRLQTERANEKATSSAETASKKVPRTSEISERSVLSCRARRTVSLT